MKKVTFIFCLIYWLLPFTGNTQQITSEASINYRIKGDFPTQPLPQPKWIILEGEQSLSIEDLRSGNLKDARMIQTNLKDVKKSDKDVSFWIHLSLSSDIAVDQWKMVIDRQAFGIPYDVDQAISQLTAHYFRNEQLIGTRFSGRDMPTSKRDLADYYYQSILFFDLVENDNLDVWFNIKAPPGPITTSINIHNSDFELSPAPWPFKVTTYNYYMGFLTTLLIIGIFLLIWFKEKIYLWFLFFLLINVATILIWKNQTFIIRLIFPEDPLYGQIFGFTMDFFKWTVLLLFGRVFINTPKHYPRLDKVILIFTALFFIVGTILINLRVNPSLMRHPILVIIIFAGILFPILGILIYFIFSKNKLARFFSIGAIIPFTAIFLIGLFREILWVRTVSEVLMSMGPMITMTLAVVYRFRLEAKGRIVAEQERSRLLENQTDLLEQQVEERTSELNQTLENLKATQSQLVQQEKLASLGQLTAGIAHEIKNPLNFVNNFSEVSMEMIEEVLDSRLKTQDTRLKTEADEIEEEILEDIKANLKKIHEHGSRANGIVTSMLQHSRGGSGKKEPTDLNALIKEYVNLSFHGMRAGKNPIDVDIELDLDPEVKEVSLIKEDFTRVVINLCNNAFDAMRGKKYEVQSLPAGEAGTKYQEGVHGDVNYLPKLKVITMLEKGRVRIAFEDNGPGIPDEIKDKILQPFFTTKKGTEGTGLGLSITHDIVKAHGGEIKIKTKENEGSTFTIEIPIV